MPASVNISSMDSDLTLYLNEQIKAQGMSWALVNCRISLLFLILLNAYETNANN